MSISNSTSNVPISNPPPRTKKAKPEKPYPEYPLTAHPAGYWCKKIRGKLHYFGPWSDPDGALAKYLDQKDDLHAGRTPQAEKAELTVKDLANHFLGKKQSKVESDELSPRTWAGYKEACDAIVTAFGKNRLVTDLGPDDFSRLRGTLAKTYSKHRLGTVIQCVRCTFKHGFDAGLMDRPVRYGQDFNRPSKKTMRLDRAKKGPKLFMPEEILKLLGAASVQMKAMIFLGINCGFGNADCGNLPINAVDLEREVIDYPRPKTGLPRRSPLWPETVAAIREALANRPDPKDPEHAGLVFITKYGLAWAKDTSDNPVSKEMSKLLRAAGIAEQKGKGFYVLRHTFRTVADEAKDQPAADYIMGHESPHMSSHYRERISDERLKAVTDHVRAWLFPKEEEGK